MGMFYSNEEALPSPRSADASTIAVIPGAYMPGRDELRRCVWLRRSEAVLRRAPGRDTGWNDVGRPRTLLQLGIIFNLSSSTTIMPNSSPIHFTIAHPEFPQAMTNLMNTPTVESFLGGAENPEPSSLTCYHCKQRRSSEKQLSRCKGCCTAVYCVRL